METQPIRLILELLAAVGLLAIADHVRHFGLWLGTVYAEGKRDQAEDRRRAEERRARQVNALLGLPYHAPNIRIEYLPTMGFMVVLTEPESGIKLTAIHDPTAPDARDKSRVELFITGDGTQSDETFAATCLEMVEERTKMRNVRQAGDVLAEVEDTEEW